MALTDTGLRGRLNRRKNLPFPKMEDIQILGCYSINTNRDYEASAEKLRYFRMPTRFPLNLNEGYGLAKEKQEFLEEQGLDHIFQYIFHHRDEMITRADAPNTRGVGDFDFICYRGLLRFIMCTPYELREDWSIHATRYKGNIYLSEKDTEKKQHKRLNPDENLKKICSYGYKFEQYCMTTNPIYEPNTSIPVDECEEFHCMYKTKLEGIKLFFSAEIDGVLSAALCQNVESKDVLNTLKLVELKCSLRPSNERQQQNFYKFKCRNWWCQCFLAGINDLMIGTRNDKGFVEEIQHMDVRSLPNLAVDYWTPSQCADFLVKFLQMVTGVMKDVNCPHTVYEFYFNPQSRMISYRVHAKSVHTILPDWYITMLQ